MDFYFNSNAPLAWSGPAEKAKGNVAAIKLARTLEAENRPATPEELATLSRYVGWGDTAVLNYGLKNLGIKELLSDDELRALRVSTLNAHFTALPVIAGIWRGFERLGAGKMENMNVLDPSAGIGHFKSMTPAALRAQTNWVEVELDQTTANILAGLHPDSKVLNMGYENANLPKNHFDIITSNVPFGKYPVVFNGMPRHLRASIHDFFFARTIDLLRPGGVMAFITSRYTLDKAEDLVRKHLAKHCDLLVAVRLPKDAFTANAGTEVVTDILFLRKRWEENKAIPEWTGTEKVNLGVEGAQWVRKEHNVNRYYIEHPENILGTPASSGSMYGSDEYTVVPDGRDLGEAIASVLEACLPEDLLTEQPAHPQEAEVISLTANADAKANKQHPEPGRVTAMRELYQTGQELIRQEVVLNMASADDLRQRLNEQYDRFVARYGKLHARPNTDAMKHEPEIHFLLSLEEEKSGKKADIFSSCTVKHENPVEHIDNPNDALLLCLDKVGRVDISLIAQISGLSEDEVIRHLSGGRIFLDPETKRWLTDDEYLSGDVVEKLKTAEAAAMFDEKYQINVTALRMAQPEALPTSRIHAKLGAGWIPEDVIEAFIQDAYGVQVTASYVEAMAEWTVKFKYVPSGVQTRWGTSRVSAENVVSNTLNGRQLTVYDIDYNAHGDERRVVNQKETTEAQARQSELTAAFANWVWRDMERALRLTAIYNAKFNVWVRRKYDGSHLTFPGLNKSIDPRKNQSNAVWRVMQSPATLVFHQVGAGKTLTAIMAAMESRRLGMARKVMAVVPNSVIPGWQKEVTEAYPQAKILTVAAGDFSASKRGTFLSRVATGDWDLVLVPYSIFTKLPVSAETEVAYIQAEVNKLEEHLWELKEREKQNESEAAAMKRIQQSLSRFQAKLANKKAEIAQDKRETITFENTGVDMLIIDEFHNFKNLFFATKMDRVAGLSASESQRALDMHMKINWLTKVRGGKVVTLTGTPVSNTLAEIYTMQRYLQPDVLEKMGLSHFDAWAAMFAEAEASIEMSPDGLGFRKVLRFKKFKNLSTLGDMFLGFADYYKIVLGDIPNMPELYKSLLKIVCERDPRMAEFLEDIAERVDAIRQGEVGPSVDNILKILNDGKKASLDISLVMPSAPGGPMPKIDTLVDQVSYLYLVTAEKRGVQMIFCDLATPKGKADKDPDENGNAQADEELPAYTLDVYVKIKARLIANGVPESAIAFAHDAKTTEQRSALYAQINAGEKRVVVASTEKMGVGVNVQERLLVTHHLTAPWRPDQIQQRTGRMVRPGNTNKEVFEFVYISPGTIEAFIWQLLEAKMGMIADFVSIFDRLEVDDLGDAVLDYGQIKAVATGNPLLIKQIDLQSEVARLDTLRAGWINRRAEMAREKARIEIEIPQLERKQAIIQEAIGSRRPVPQKFYAKIEGVTYEKYGLAGAALQIAAERAVNLSAPLITFRGLPIYAYELWKTKAFSVLHPDIGLRVTSTDKPETLFTRINNVVNDLDEQLSQAIRDIQNRTADLATIVTEIAQPWAYDAEYAQATTQLAEVSAEIERFATSAMKVEVCEDTGDNEELRVALARIKELHPQQIEANPEPAIQAIQVTPEVIAQVRHEIQRQQAQLDFLQAVAMPPSLPVARTTTRMPQPVEFSMQASMFGDAVPAHMIKKGGKRKR